MIRIRVLHLFVFVVAVSMLIFALSYRIEEIGEANETREEKNSIQIRKQKDSIAKLESENKQLSESNKQLEADIKELQDSYLSKVDWGRWQRLHGCEQPGNWYANGGNPADPGRQTFQGGLGMSTVAWRMAVRAASNRGIALPVSALQATPRQQMVGAQAFYDAHGWGWSCVV